MQALEGRKSQYQYMIRILFPVLVYQLANFSASLIDTMMTGNYNERHLAGVSIASNLWWPFFSLATGILSALTPVVGHHVGARNEHEISHDVRQFMYLALGLSVLLMGLGFMTVPSILEWMQVEPDIRQISQDYLMNLSIGIPPILLLTTMRSLIDGLGLTRISMIFMLLLVPFNTLFNYTFIYGKFGFQMLGGGGAGLGTALTYWVVLGIVIGIVRIHPRLQQYMTLGIETISFYKIVSFLRVGLPIGLTYSAEAGIFALIGLLMVRYSATVIAAHQAAINFASFMYSFPSSMSFTLTIVVSQAYGAQNYKFAKDLTRRGIELAVMIAVIIITVVYFNRSGIAQAYGRAPQFVAYATQFISYSLLFQVADAINAPIQGVLRGYKDTMVPFIATIVSFWLIGIPIGLALANVTTIGPASFWIALITGLFTCAGLQALRLFYIEKNIISL